MMIDTLEVCSSGVFVIKSLPPEGKAFEFTLYDYTAPLIYLAQKHPLIFGLQESYYCATI